MGEDDARPLSGKRVLVTRAQAQNKDLCERIKQIGGEPYEFPTIRISPPASYRELDEAIRQLSRYTWVIFTSVNGVDHFFRRLSVVTGEDARQLVHTSIAAIGPKTAKALTEKGLKVDVLPGEYRAEALLSELKQHVTKVDKILLPRASVARNVLPDGLRAIGCDVTVVDAYQTEPETEKASEVVKLLAERQIDIITFTSPSTVRHFVLALDQTGEPWRDWITEAQIVCIGPITESALNELGLESAAVAADYTVEGLVEAIETLT